jgi:UDP:flavonoid glycosyltransferase YjiC (YdhE family)
MVDQPFWGARVQALGVGPTPIPRPRLTASGLAEAMQVAGHNAAMHARAAALGEKIRAEDGCARAAMLISGWIDGSAGTSATPDAGSRGALANKE